MCSKKTIIRFIPLGTIILATATMLAALPRREHGGPASSAQEKVNQREDEKRMPTALYSASLPADPTERALRLARSGRYDKRDPLPFDELSPSARGRGVVSDWYTHISALPAVESDLIIRGEVINASAYLSNDRTGAYSEFGIQVDEVFKNDGRLFGRSVVALREGADVQLPSGRTIRYEIVYQGMPVIGRQYVFFLKYNEGGRDYTILTAYELRKSRVYPLDDVGPFTTYKKSDESIFLNAVREAIGQAAPKGGSNQ